LADDYEAVWAESGGLQSLSPIDRLTYLTGADMIRLASDSSAAAELTRREGFLTGADAMLEGVRGFSEGMVEGLQAAAQMVPELLAAVPTLAYYLAAPPDVQVETLARILLSLPKVKEYVILAIARVHDQWVSGGVYERSRLIGRATFEVGTFLATGEIAGYLRVAGEAGEVAKLSRVRKELALALQAIDEGGEFGRAFSKSALAAVTYNLPPTAVRPLLELTATNREGAAALLSVRGALETANIGNLDTIWTEALLSWGGRDADTAFSLKSVIEAGPKGLAPTTSVDLLKSADRYVQIRTGVGLLPRSVKDEFTVFRAIPQITKDTGTVLTESNTFQLFPGMSKNIGRYKEPGELVWSTVVAEEGKDARIAAYNTAIEEFGQYNNPEKAFFLVDRSISSKNVLVLDQEATRMLGLNPADLTKLNAVLGCYTDTLMISRAARGAGFEIIIAPSAIDPSGARVAHILNRHVLGQ